MSVFEKKGANPETLVRIALKDEKVLQEALDGVLSKKDVVRQNSFQTLNFLSEKHPDKISARSHGCHRFVELAISDFVVFLSVGFVV